MSALKRLCCIAPDTVESTLGADQLEQAILTGSTSAKQTQMLRRQLYAYSQPTVVPREGSASYLVNLHRRSSVDLPDSFDSSTRSQFVRLSSTRSNLLTSDVLAGNANAGPLVHPQGSNGVMTKVMT